MINIGEDGSFELIIDSTQLSKGLRPSKRMSRNSGFLVECKGAVGLDGVLQIIDELTRITTPDVAFPFPQLFVFTRVIIVCYETTIYEWDGDSLSEKITDLTAGGPWSAVDLFDCIYLSNGRQAVVRNAGSKEYEVDADLPSATTICNFNGQILIGAPDADADVAELVMPLEILSLTTTMYGDGLVGLVKGDTISTSVTIHGDYSG